jgi:N-acetylglucosamine-6-phosphate deacetylase
MQVDGVTVLAAARVANGEGGISASPAWVVVDGDRIVATGTGAPPGGDVHDLGDALLAPGFVDLQVNGIGAIDFATATVEELVHTVDELSTGGCTACVPTLISAPLDTYDSALTRLHEAQAQRPNQILGVHLEGPFLGGAPGAHPPELLQPVVLDWLVDICDRFGDLIRIVTLAPEADPELRATQALSQRGIVVALGHSLVDYDGARAAADAGARMVTHLFNGMGPLHHRAPGLAGAALDDRRLVPSVIADFVHVHPAVVRLALTARADAVVVTDAVAIAGGVKSTGGAAYLPDGTLAGATSTMADAVRNIASLDLSPAKVIRHASANPARVLGHHDHGRIAPGARAHLVALDPETLSLRRVWLGGQWLDR